MRRDFLFLTMNFLFLKNLAPPPHLNPVSAPVRGEERCSEVEGRKGVWRGEEERCRGGGKCRFLKWNTKIVNA